MGQFNTYDPFHVDTPPIPRHPDDPYIGKCDCCGEECERRPGVLFCSWVCKDKGSADARPDKSCKMCGQYYTPSKATQKFCGRDCQMLDLQAKNKRFREIEGADKCLHCDKELPARKKGLARKYCSNKCRSRATYLRNIKGIPDKRKCMQCKELFTPKTKQGQLCSLECKRQNKRSLERQRYRDKNPGSVIYKTKQFRT